MHLEDVLLLLVKMFMWLVELSLWLTKLFSEVGGAVLSETVFRRL
jgi:hypothetical protein